MKPRLTRYNAVDRVADLCGSLEPIAANSQCSEQERIIGLSIHCLHRLDKDFAVLSRQLKERNKAYKVASNDLAIARFELEQRRADVLRLSEDLRKARAEVERWKDCVLFGGEIVCQNMGDN